MGLVEFDDYYSKIYGDRWSVLRDAILGSDLKVARRNLWIGELEFLSRNPIFKEIPEYIEGCWRVADAKSQEVSSLLAIPQGTIPRSDDGLLDYYIMDPASVLTARALPLTHAEKVLDLCAAPGGKTLVLFENLKHESELWSNEFSPGRRESLIRVVKQYIPFTERQRIWVKGSNGEKFGLKHAEEFDSILVDAPCSGERHLLENKSEMAEWSPKRGKNLSRRQFALLSSAWLALKPGGFLLYSTCSINPVENEELIAEFLDRKGTAIQLVKPVLEIPGELPTGDQSKAGVYYLPDKCGFGPMYLCLMRKI